MPTWEQRWCRNIGPGKNYTDWNSRALSKECSGHGKCDESGACMCETGYAGHDHDGCSGLGVEHAWCNRSVLAVGLLSASCCSSGRADTGLPATRQAQASPPTQWKYSRIPAQQGAQVARVPVSRDSHDRTCARRSQVSIFTASHSLVVILDGWSTLWHRSHKWPTGQDACASIRVQLIERTTPEMGIRVFL
eukprot:243717-Prymnesium_polylepis.1